MQNNQKDSLQEDDLVKINEEIEKELVELHEKEDYFGDEQEEVSNSFKSMFDYTMTITLIAIVVFNIVLIVSKIIKMII